MIHRSIFHHGEVSPRNLSVNTIPQQTVSIARFMGRWYEQARYENWFESGMERVYADYALNSKGTINITNSGTNRNGTRTQSRGRGTPKGYGLLLVSFVPPYWWFQSPYHILYTDDCYQMALISGAASDFLWLLTRERNAPQEQLNRLLEEARQRGFDTSRLRVTIQDD